jgi:hypothetical protein
LNGESFFKRHAHLLLFLGISLTAFFPSLALNQAYFPNDLINQYIHFRTLLRSQLMAGHFPLWNPYFFGGQPFFADPNVMACYPLNYVTFLFPPVYGLGVFFFLHMFIAAAGMHFLLKSLKVSETACRIGGLTFALSGFFWWEVIHPPILAAFCWFPWLIGCLEQVSRKWSAGWAFLSGLCFAVVFCCGNFQSTTVVLYTALAYFFFRVLVRDDAAAPGTQTPGFPWKKFLAAFLIAVWGGLPLLLHFVPANEFSEHTNRRSENQTYDNFNGTFSMVPRSTYEFLIPSLGVPKGQTIEFANQVITDTKNVTHDFLGVFGYVGVWVPFFFVLAFQRKDKRFLYFLASVGLLSILAAWGRFFPLHEFFCNVLPGVNLSRAPFRYIQAYVLAACVLTAYGYQALDRLTQEKGGARRPAFLGGLYALVLFIISVTRPEMTWRELLALGLGAAGLLLWCLTESWVKLGKWFFQAALVLPLMLSGWGNFSQGPVSNFDYETNFPAFTYLKNNPKDCRYYFDQSLNYPIKMGGLTYKWNFPQDAPMVFGLRDSGGYNPIVLKKSTEIRTLPLKSNVQLMCIRGMLFGENKGEPPEMVHKTLDSIHYYEPKVQPRYVNAPFLFQFAPDRAKSLQALAKPDFDAATQAVLNESLPHEVLSQLPGKKADLQYEITKDEMDSQAYKIRLDLNSLVVFSEVIFPGWKAFIDGAPAPLLTANHALRAVFVPAGEHEVVFRYEPSWAKPLLAGFIAWLVSVFAYGLYLLRKKPASSDPPPHA